MRTRLQAVLPRVIFAISPRSHMIEPASVVTIPLDGFSQSSIPRFLGMPVELALDQTWINCISSIMSRPIFNEANQRARFSKGIEHAVRDFEVASLVTRANIVSRASLTPFKQCENRPAMIFNVDPVPYIHAVAVNRNRFIVHRVG